VLDGEVAIFDQQLRSRFDWLRQGPAEEEVATPPMFIAFDVLYRRGHPIAEGVRLPSTCWGCGSDTTPGSIDLRLCGHCSHRTCKQCRRYGGVHDPSCSQRA
jgi:hypothetical protein